MPKTDKQPAPYIPFKTFLTAVEVLEQGLPDTIDKSVWPTLSFSVQAHTLSAFKFLQLVDDEGHVQDDLRRLVAQKEERKTVVREILEKRYPNVAALGDKNASTQQLHDAIKEHDASSSLLVKAVRFFIQAATYADLPLSPLWKTGKGSTTKTPAKRSIRKRRQTPPTPSGDENGPSEQNWMIVDLPSGGRARLAISVDVTKMSMEERTFIFDLVDRMSTFNQAQKVPATEGNGGEATE